MDIKTKGFSMPDGNTHIFIPPAPTETDRGGITAKSRTTEAAEVVVDSDTGKCYIGTDHTLKAKGQAADSEAVGIAISEKADRIISSASGENVILTDSAEAPLQGFKVFGKSTQNGEPTPENPVPIVSVGDKGSVELDVTGRNLFDASKLPSKSQGGATVTNNGDGSFTISGSGNLTETYSCYYIITDKKIIKTILKVGRLKVKGSGTANSNPYFAISAESASGSRIFAVDADDKSFEITEEILNTVTKVIINFWGASGSTIKANTVYPMIYVDSGENKVEYEPYRTPQSLTLSTPNGLPGIKVDSDGNYTDSDGQQWVCDERDYEREKYVQRIWNAIIDENASIRTTNIAGNNRFSVYDSKSFPSGESEIYGLCNSLKVHSAPLNRNEIDETISCYGVDGGIHFRFDRFKTVDELKVWLKTNPIEYIYVLVKPIERDLTPEEIVAYKALHTNYPTTVIGNDENAGMEATYVADTKNYIDKKFEKLNQAIVNTQIALL